MNNNLNSSQAIAQSTSPGLIRAFWEGVRTPWDGLIFMNQHPALWRFAVIPTILNLLITALTLAALIFLSVKLMGGWMPDFGQAWLWSVMEFLAAVLLITAALGVALIAWCVLQGVLCGYFYGKLAEAVERKIGLGPEEIRNIPLSYLALDALRDAVFLATANLLCLSVQFVPGLGSVVGLCGSLYFNCSTFGMEYLDYPLSLRGGRLHEKRAFVRRHRAHTLGLGATVLAVTLLPVASSVFLTTAVTGAVLLHRRLAPGEHRSV